MKETALSELKFNPLIATNSTKFLVPFILPSKYYLNKLKFGFVNAYIGDANRPWLDDKIFLVFKTNGTLNAVRDKLENNKHYYNSYWITIKDESYSVFTFNVPFEYKKQINFIKKGFTTSLDSDSKKIILDFWSNGEHNVYKSLFNDRDSIDTQLEISNDIIREEDIVPSIMESMLGTA